MFVARQKDHHDLAVVHIKLQPYGCCAIEFSETGIVIGPIAYQRRISTCKCSVIVCMAEDPLGGLIGTFPILELLKRVAAGIIAIPTLLKSWVVRFIKSWCVVGDYHYTTFMLRPGNLIQSFLKPLRVSVMFCVVVCNGPVLDLLEVVSQVSPLRYERV